MAGRSKLIVSPRAWYPFQRAATEFITFFYDHRLRWKWLVGNIQHNLSAARHTRVSLFFYYFFTVYFHSFTFSHCSVLCICNDHSRISIITLQKVLALYDVLPHSPLTILINDFTVKRCVSPRQNLEQASLYEARNAFRWNASISCLFSEEAERQECVSSGFDSATLMIYLIELQRLRGKRQIRKIRATRLYRKIIVHQFHSRYI